MGDWDVEAAGALMRHLDEQRVKEFLNSGVNLSSVRVRQHGGRWHPGDEVAERFRALDRTGYFLRLDGAVYGPFILPRFRVHLLEIVRQAQSDVEFEVRQGITGAWRAIRVSHLTTAIDDGLKDLLSRAAAPEMSGSTPAMDRSGSRPLIIVPTESRRDRQGIPDYLPLRRKRAADPAMAVGDTGITLQEPVPTVHMMACEHCGWEILASSTACPECGGLQSGRTDGDRANVDGIAAMPTWMRAAMWVAAVGLLAFPLAAWWRGSITDPGGPNAASDDLVGQLGRLPRELYDYVLGGGIRSPRARAQWMSTIEPRLTALGDPGQPAELDQLGGSGLAEAARGHYQRLRRDIGPIEWFDGYPAAVESGSDIREQRAEGSPSGRHSIHLDQMDGAWVVVVTTRMPLAPTSEAVVVTDVADHAIRDARGRHAAMIARARLGRMTDEFKAMIASEWDQIGPRLLEEMIGGNREVVHIPAYSGIDSGGLLVGLRVAHQTDALVLQTVVSPAIE
jgi:hypothetical protein